MRMRRTRDFQLCRNRRSVWCLTAGYNLKRWELGVSLTTEMILELNVGLGPLSITLYRSRVLQSRVNTKSDPHFWSKPSTADRLMDHVDRIGRE